MPTSINITINKNSILDDMQLKSHLEVASIADPQARYFAELGSEKEEEAHQCINDAVGEVMALLTRRLSSATGAEDDSFDPGDVVFAISSTGRYNTGLQRALTLAIHAYIVDSALAKFYGSVSHPELATPHINRLPVQKSYIDALIYSKNEPTYPNP